MANRSQRITKNGIMAVLENLIDNNYGIIHMFRQLFRLLPFKRFGFLLAAKLRRILWIYIIFMYRVCRLLYRICRLLYLNRRLLENLEWCLMAFSLGWILS